MNALEVIGLCTIGKRFNKNTMYRNNDLRYKPYSEPEVLVVIVLCHYQMWKLDVFVEILSFLVDHVIRYEVAYSLVLAKSFLFLNVLVFPILQRFQLEVSLTKRCIINSI